MCVFVRHSPRGLGAQRYVGLVVGGPGFGPRYDSDHRKRGIRRPTWRSSLRILSLAIPTLLPRSAQLSIPQRASPCLPHQLNSTSTTPCPASAQSLHVDGIGTTLGVNLTRRQLETRLKLQLARLRLNISVLGSRSRSLPLILPVSASACLLVNQAL